MAVPLSVLDLAPVSTGTSAAECVRRTVDLARLADRLGFRRYWFAEHTTVAETGADELMIVTNVWSHEARLRSYELLAEALA